ncbi:MAG TPA: ATP-binding protein [Acholeplasmataceae bacterium]|jgi:primosomal protein DnaI|nr:ATP-binding protein [Acholeplasmataceae bacterium]
MNRDNQQLISMLFEDPLIRGFCKKNELNEEEILDNLGKFIIQKENNELSKDCTFERCNVDGNGMHTALSYQNKRVELKSVPCSKFEQDYDEYLDLRYFPESNEFMTQELVINKHRSIALKRITDFVNEYKKGRFTKGIFFHGPFGTGKTFLMMTLAKNLSKVGVKVFVAYYPDLVRFMKSSISTGELEKIIRDLKNSEVLMLDDVGAESNSAFIRDEVLGPILQYRLHENLPVCMTSNLSILELQNHFSETRDQIDLIKSARICERLRFLMSEVKLNDKNYRTEVDYTQKS